MNTTQNKDAATAPTFDGQGSSGVTNRAFGTGLTKQYRKASLLASLAVIIVTLLFTAVAASAQTHTIHPGATYTANAGSGQTLNLRVPVPAGTTSLVFETWGGTGDADLYFAASGSASRTNYSARSTGSAANEKLTINNPPAANLSFALYGDSAFSGVQIRATVNRAQGGPVATPVINPGGQSSMSPITVTMSCSTSGATIRYTTNGNDPTSTSTIYSGAFTLSTSTTVKARAFKSGMANSAVAATSYSIMIPSITILSNGSTVSGLSGAASSERQFKVRVPSGQSKLEIKISGGTGDADLYVKRGAMPTTSSYDARPYLSGNAETATINNPTSGDWYVMVRGFSNYSGVTLIATYNNLNNANQAMSNALANLGKKNGSVTWNGVTKSEVWATSSMTYCARFSRMCLGRFSGVFEDANQMYAFFNGKKVVKTTGTPPAGAAVFYTSGQYGHTGIADNNSKLVSPTSLTTGVTSLNVLKPFNSMGYLGYVTADDFITYHP